ncbi:MAG: hypothetical protein ACKV2Q_11400 [Planctomycetaceae bacterium]
MTRYFLQLIVACGVLLGLFRSAVAAERTSIALTTATANPYQQLAENLIVLVEANVLADDSLAVVERRQIDLAMQELALSRTRSADESLQLGKLVTADLLVMLELRPSDDKKIDKPSALLRVVEAKTAAIRGITVASDVEASSLEEIAEQFTRYVSTVIHQPQVPTVTVAVAPFESVGRFDRLRPLELGIRDLVTVRLLRLNSPGAPRQGGRTSPRSESENESSNVARDSAVLSRSDRATFQVLQRSNLEQLLRELDLIQSGFADKERLPRTLPDRQAAFLIKGEIDERQVDGKFTIIVRGELRHAATAKVRDSFEFECALSDLETQLAARVDQFVTNFGLGPNAKSSISRNALASGSKGESTSEPDASAFRLIPGHEADSLKSLALRDLHRFRRICPIDHGYRAFAMPGESSMRNVPRLVKADTPLGQALLRKSIDRLETALFIHPDDVEAAYALGFCFSIHQPNVFQPDRADELLRKAASRQPDSEQAALALAFLSELAFDDQDGGFNPLPKGSAPNPQTLTAARNAAAERLWLAFEKTPEAFRDFRWPRILELFAPLQRTPEQNAALLAKVIPITEQADAKHRHQLAGEVKTLALRLAAQSPKQPQWKAKAIESLRRWADGSDEQLADFGRQGLAAFDEVSRDFLEAARKYETAAAAMSDATSPRDRLTRDMQLVKAAKNYRLAKQPERALRLLQSFKPPASPAWLAVGYHGYEIGACHEALGDPKAAVAAYLLAVEECPGISANSDLAQRVLALGGVPLREDRDVDVKYITREDNRPLRTISLATDGRRLFLGGVVFARPPNADGTGRRFYGGVGVAALDPDSETWESFNADLEVTCIKLRDRELWVGTFDRGLWRCDLDTKKWTSFGKNEGLPDLHIESIAIRGDDVFVGVGSAAAGGLIRIDNRGTVHLFNEHNAPNIAPTHLIVTDKELLARTLKTLHKLSWESKSWTTQTNTASGSLGIAWRLFAGTSGIWANSYGRELTRFEADEDSNQIFKPAWYFVPGTKAGYFINFVAERGDDVWFGGEQWDHFLSSGLYRINLKTGAFHKFGPADGFKTVHAHSIFDGIWLRDRLWLGTSNGLCVVTPRITSSRRYARDVE